MNKKWFLYIIAIGICFFLWQKWQVETQAHLEQQSQIQQAQTPNSALPAPAADASHSDIPQAAQDIPHAASHDDAPPESPVTTDTAQLITVYTDVYELSINLQGGTVTSVKLLDYPRSLEDPTPLQLMRPVEPHLFMLQSGLAGQADAPNHYALYRAAQSEYRLADDADELRVPLLWQNEAGVTVEKSFIFKRGKHDFVIDHHVRNNSAEAWNGFAYAQLLRSPEKRRGGIGQVYTYTGGVFSSDEKSYEKYSFDEMRKKNLDHQTTSGWVAMIQQYFLAALIPEQSSNSRLYSSALDNGNFLMGASSPAVSVAPNDEHSYRVTAFVGPKLQEELAQVANKLDKTVDYGFLFMIAQPMFKVLLWLHNHIFQNWGWSIIVMTLLIKMLFFIPSAWAYKSMAKMRRIGPEIERMKETYGDDRQRMSMAMMELYRKEKINPMSGCLPILFQIPFFIAFYWVLIESVELRQSPWILWVEDLSVMDPYFVLPIANMGLMYVQQLLNPPPPDPMQARVMRMLPLIFGILFMWFPAGLLLYWCVSNAFAIVQQSIMNKRYGQPLQATKK